MSESTEQSLLLIDAYSQIFRSFYAVAGLSNSQGVPTNALYAFCKLLQRIDREYPSNLGAMVFDCGRVQFRLKLNPGYKANRKPMPDELKVQIPLIRELATAFGWEILEEPEFEADDLIGALAQQYQGTVKIVSADKDLSQLICDRIVQLVPDSKNGFVTRSEAEVAAKFNVTPDLIVDYLALLGDSADNIPGADGIGAITAAKLLNQYGHLTPLLDNLEQVDNLKLRAKLTAAKERLYRNIELIKLRTDLPARLTNIEHCCQRRAPDWDKIRDFCEKMELFSILKSLPGVATSPKPGEPPKPAEPKSFQDDLFGNF